MIACGQGMQARSIAGKLAGVIGRMKVFLFWLGSWDGGPPTGFAGYPGRRHHTIS